MSTLSKHTLSLSRMHTCVWSIGSVIFTFTATATGMLLPVVVNNQAYKSINWRLLVVIFIIIAQFIAATFGLKHTFQGERKRKVKCNRAHSRHTADWWLLVSKLTSCCSRCWFLSWCCLIKRRLARDLAWWTARRSQLQLFHLLNYYRNFSLLISLTWPDAFTSRHIVQPSIDRAPSIVIWASMSRECAP